MNFSELLVLLLNENAALWDGEDWIEFDDSRFNNLWVHYALSCTVGPQFEIWYKGQIHEVVFSVEELENVLIDFLY